MVPWQGLWTGWFQNSIRWIGSATAGHYRRSLWPQ